jgi:hypothetical protein
MDKSGYACTLAVAFLPLAALYAQPASAQLPGLQPFPCHVLHVTNQTHNPALVTVSIDTAGISRVGAGMVDACTSGDIQLAPNLRCGVAFNVRGELKDPGKVPAAIFKLNPAAAPTIAEVKGTFTPQNAKEAANWLALVGVPGKQLGWKPVAAGTKMPPGCPAAPPAPATVTFTFNNTTGSPVLVWASGQAVVFDRACIGAGQSRTVQAAPSSAYKVLAASARDAQCQQTISSPIGFGAQPVNGRVTVSYVTASYAMKQLETTPQPGAPGQPTNPTQDPTVSSDPTAPTQGIPTQDPTTTTVPTGK